MQLGTGSLGIWAWLFLVAILIATNTTASQPSLAAAAPRIAGSGAPHWTLFFFPPTTQKQRLVRPLLRAGHHHA